ncbi:hemolysin-type calcium-binding repeat 2 copies family protein [Asticcacaulis biprosthecium C19]|uniref:Hemolysin-type calcium-binding repeat 2 copies family protein n=1 Tax=Asticcacaulis biprosthecium C19 TaxID=715226 RepID=F4QGK2_9CAUL|nr:calcium-binding protein [Asticcacaulis biprosthecium]EGF93683.1 hemolysin-type calcium-binding repeat 2 copies family protein [Asticcacaulis biprosthecium C19]
MAGLFSMRSDVNASALAAAPAVGAVLGAPYVGTGGNDTYAGGVDPDEIYGGQGDDVLSGGGGNDNLGGEIGNDTVSGDDGDDTVDGGHGDDSVWGGAGNDLVLGGEGADTMAGGAGNDTYYITNAGDTVVEAADEGTDWLHSQLSIDLTAIGVENVSLMTSVGTQLIGNGLNNVMYGNAGDDSFWGGAGNDSLNGFGGNDSLSGGTGDDTYFVDSSGDTVAEADGEGTDIVYTGATYSLVGRAVENAILLGVGNISLTGNALNNQLSGNAGTNGLNGGGGNDWLDGGNGADTLVGGLGDDTFYVDNLSDLAVELHHEGNDTVLSSVTYSLFGRAVETLMATGEGHVSLTGNSLANTVTGNSGNNALNGGTGKDTLTGGLGDDSYWVDNTGDKVVEASGEGFDTVFASVTYTLAGRYAEVLELTGAANLNATGNSVSNTLRGNGGNNTLNGLAGNDILTGNGGLDVFLFSAGSRADTVTDFTVADGDLINVNAYTGGVANAGLVTQSGLNVVINLGSGNVITVLNAAQADVLSHIVW